MKQPSAEASAAIGACAGGGVGIIFGLITRSIPLSIFAPYNPLLLAAATGIMGSAAGALAAWVYGLGISHESIAVCDESSREHGAVVFVHANEPAVESIVHLLTEHGAAALRTDEDPWRATGWTGPRIDAHVYPSDSSIRSHHAHA